MQKIVVIIIFLFFYIHIQAQQCPKFQDAMKRGNNYLALKNFDGALNEFRTAQTAARECKTNPNLADDGINKAYEGIKKQRDDAKSAEDKAVKAQREAEAVRDSLKNMNEELTRKNEENDSLQKENTSFKDIVSKNNLLSQISFGETSSDTLQNVNGTPGASMSNAAKNSVLKKPAAITNLQSEFVQNYLYLKGKVDSIYSKSPVLPRQLHYNFIMAVFEYSFDLLNKQDSVSAKNILFSAVEITKQSPLHSADLLFAHARLENALAKFYSGSGDKVKSYTCRYQSVIFSRQAIELDTSNLDYKRALVVELKNLTYAPDSLFSQQQKIQFEDESRKLAFGMENKPGVDTIALDMILSYRYDDASGFIEHKKTDDAEMILKRYLSRLEFLNSENQKTKELYLYKTRLQILLAKVSVLKGDTVAARQTLYNALNSWLVTFNGKLESVRNIYLIEDSYNEMKDMAMQTCNDKDKVLLYQKLTAKVEADGLSVFNFPQVQTIMKDAYTILSNLTDDEAKLSYIEKTIKIFEYSNVMYDNKFTEEFSDYCGIYLKLLKFYNEKKQTSKIVEVFEEMRHLFVPLLNKYPFDYYLRDKLILANQIVGLALAENQDYAKAKPLLEYASTWGTKVSSEKLAALYLEGKFGNADSNKSAEYEKIAGRQSVEKFTVSCIFGNEKASFDFYVKDLFQNTPYKGIEDQAEWLLKARGGIVPEQTRQSFIKLQELAWKNNVSYPALCVYAVDAANEEKDKKNVDSFTLLIKNEQSSFDDKKDAYTKLINLASKDDAKKANKDSLYKLVSGLSLLLTKHNDIKSADSLIAKYVNTTYTDLNAFRKIVITIKDTQEVLLMYEALIRLYKTSFKQNHYDEVIGMVIQAYNSLGWYQLLNKHFTASENTIREAMSLSKSILYLDTNLPPLLLLQGKFNEAKELYLKWKDVPFDPENKLPTFRDAFLDDIKTFEKNNLIPVAYKNDFEKIKSLLTN